MRKDLLQVFFGKNRIVVYPTESMDYPHSVPHSPSRLHVSKFLKEVVPKDGLRHLRYLEIVFEQFECIGHLAWCESGSSELLDSERTIEDIKLHLVSSNLAIKISFPPDMGRIYGRSPDAQDEDYIFSQEEFLNRRKCYFNTVLPLQRLSCHLNYLAVCIYGDMEEPGRTWKGD
jgi:hypothetical protein